MGVVPVATGAASQPAITRRLKLCVIELVVTKPKRCNRVPGAVKVAAARSRQCMTKSASGHATTLGDGIDDAQVCEFGVEGGERVQTGGGVRHPPPLSFAESPLP